jgi:hypothetical protein
MSKFLCIRRSQPNNQAEMGERPSPAQMEAMYAQFNAWRTQFKDNIVDMGGKLSERGAVLTLEGAQDGPFVEVKEIVGGFMILEATSAEEALQVARECPGMLTPGASLEVREIITS